MASESLMNKEQLEHLLDLMSQMKTAAINGHWSVLKELDTRRYRYLHSAKQNPLQDSAHLSEISQQILELDKQILSHVQSSHNTIALSPAPRETRQQAVSQYQQFSHLLAEDK